MNSPAPSKNVAVTLVPVKFIPEERTSRDDVLLKRPAECLAGTSSISPNIKTMRSLASNFDIPAGLSLRTELSLRALAFAKEQKLLCERTDGSVPGVLFGQDD